jgi:hypothetical protein
MDGLICRGNNVDPDTIWNAIFGQESNSGQNNRTSVTGAIGPGQIQPGTWRQYARPGESIYNNNDNIAVSKRIVNDLVGRYGPDPARVATAYFSGPGNVSASNSPTPFVQNKTDPTGKSTASYVSDISRRISNMPVDKNFDPNTAFGQWETPTQAAPVQTFDPAAFSKWETPTQATPAAQPVSSSQSGSTIPVPREAMTPAQKSEQDQGYANAQNMPGWWQQNYHPLQSITDAFQSGRSQAGGGLQDIAKGNVATGTGNLVMGGLNTALAPVLGPYNETARAAGMAIGNPQAADVASLVLPTRGVGGAVTAALPETRAAQGIINLVGKDNIPAVVQRLQANPNLSLMDVSEPVRTVAAGIANSPETPAAQNVMRSAYDARTGARQSMVQDAVDKTLGAPMNVKDVTDQLSQNLKDVGTKLIQPALAGAQPVGVKPILERLDAVINSPTITAATKTELQRYRQQIAGNGDFGFVDPNQLHNIQWPLRAFAENLAKSTSGVEKNMSGPLMNVRNDLVDAIDNASGGKYKPALSQYRDASAVPDAFDKGYKGVFKTGGLEDFPEYFDSWIKGDPANNIAPASPQEIAAARVGAITRVRQTISGMQGGSTRGERILLPEFAQQKLSSLFNPTQVSQLSGLLEDARGMSDTNSLLYKNSKTAQVTAGQNYFQPRQVGTPSGAATGVGAGLFGAMAMAGGAIEPGLVGLGASALKAGHMGMQYVGKLADKSTATNFAKLASASDGPSRNQLLNILRAASSAGQGNKLGNLNSSMLRLAAP